MRRVGIKALCRVRAGRISTLAREKLLGHERQPTLDHTNQRSPPRHDFLDEFAQPLNKSQTVVETMGSKPLCTQVVLNVPQNNNRPDFRTAKDFLQALQQKRDGRALKALLIRGANNRESNFFCGGYDWFSLRELLHTGQEALAEETIRTGLKLIFFTASSSSHYLTSASLPFLMSIINGRAESWGTGLALYTDFACMTRGAEVVFNGPEYGLPAHGGWYRLLLSSNRRHPGVAQYLLCTPGVPLYAADCMRLGLGQLRTSDQPELTIKELLRATGDRWDYHTVTEALMHAQDLFAGEDSIDPCTLTEDRLKWINECFGLEMDLERIIFNLETFKAKHAKTPSSARPKSSPYDLGVSEDPETPAEWADKTLRMIQGVSPTALKVSFAILRRTKDQELSLSEVLELEFRAIMRLLKHQDFKYMMQNLDDEHKAGLPAHAPAVYPVRLKPMSRVAEEFQPSDLFDVTQDAVDALLQPFDWDTEGLVEFDAINETWAEGDIVGHVNQAQKEGRVEVVDDLGSDGVAAEDSVYVPITDQFGELAQLWSEMGLNEDLQSRTRWDNYLEHFKSFQYLFKEEKFQEDPEVQKLEKNLQLYESLLVVDQMEQSLAQKYLWEKWDRYLPVFDKAPDADSDEELLRTRMRQLYHMAKQLKQFRDVKLTSTTDYATVPNIDGQHAGAEEGGFLIPSLEAQVRYGIMLFSEVDMRVITNARTALMAELKDVEEVPSHEALMERLKELVRQEVLATVPQLLTDPNWKPEFQIDAEQIPEKEDLTDAALSASGGVRPKAASITSMSASEKLALPIEEYFTRRIQHLMTGWPENQQQIMIDIEVETAKRLQARGLDVMDRSVDMRQVAEAWHEEKHSVMQDRQAAGYKVYLDVQPQMSLEALRELKAKGLALYPHEERLLWSGETTYPSRVEAKN